MSEALEKSIKHWEENAAATDFNKVDITSSSCALCEAHEDCADCPVMKRTGKSYCGGSPYCHAADAYFAWKEDPYDPELRDAFSQAEVDFLKSLRKV